MDDIQMRVGDEEIRVGSLVVDRADATRVGVVCVAAFRISHGPGAWVLWPGEEYAWTPLKNMKPARQSK